MSEMFYFDKVGWTLGQPIHNIRDKIKVPVASYWLEGTKKVAGESNRKAGIEADSDRDN